MIYRKTRTACYLGYMTHAVAVNLAPLLFACFQRTYGVSLGFLAFLTLVTFVVQIAVDLSAVSFMEKVSFRALAASSQLTIAAGLVMMGMLPRLFGAEAGLLIAALFYSFGSGLAEVVLSPLVDAIPDKGKGSLAILHSFYSWGHALVIVVTTALLSLIGDSLWFLVPITWSVVPLYTAKCFCRAPMPEMTYHDEKSGIKGLLRCKAFTLLFVLMLCSGAAEQIMAQWSSFYAEVGLGVEKVAGDLLGPCIFALMMALGRIAYGVFGEKINVKKVLIVSSLLTVICFFSAALSPVPFVSLVACGLSGVGVSIMWPGILSTATEKYRGGGASMFALLAFGGDIGCSVGPFITGCVSEAVAIPQLSIRMGILSGVVFPIIMTIGLIIFLKHRTE